MDQLNKHQIILLTLLITFVTSIATGIVTVTLLEKAPPGITQTINRVVEHTIEKIVPTETGKATVVTERVVIKEEDLIVKAVEDNAKSIIALRGINTEGVEQHLGLGFLVSADGLAVTAKGVVEGIPPESLSALYNGKHLAIQILPQERESDFVILKISLPLTEDKNTSATTTDAKKVADKFIFTPTSLSDSNQVKLGQTAIFLGGVKGTTVVTGIVSDLVTETKTDFTTKKEETRLHAIKTGISLSRNSAGAPLITMEGAVAGVMIADPITGVDTAVPINDVKEVIIAVTTPKKDAIPASKTSSN
ncbi:MAG: trypsin-like peptidase domain-containing protein [Candidatus Yonathbacteria bacterium]|nr:trypsin-like peptidase domain-containing protein [Candidatus Yonathbacteria bacterium]